MKPFALVFWIAYRDLQHERPPARYVDGETIPQQIPWSAIAAYARFHGMNVDELKLIVWSLDALIIESGAATQETKPND